MTELRVDSLAKRFGGLKVFQDISFALPEGGLLGVIGPIGAGKTTLINVISGRQPASAGRVILGGRISPTSLPMPSADWGWRAASSRPTRSRVFRWGRISLAPSALAVVVRRSA